MREPIQFVGTPLEEVAIKAWAGHEGFRYLPINILVGEGVTLPGTIGHVKSVLDSMLRRGELEKVIWMRGTPTIMIGAIDDPDFEQHLEEGPYVVFDDAAKPEYKNDARVYFVPSHPVLQTAMPELMKGLGVSWPGQAVMKWEQFERRGMHNLKYGTAQRKALTIGKPLVTAALLVGGLAALTRLMTRVKHEV